MEDQYSHYICQTCHVRLKDYERFQEMTQTNQERIYQFEAEMNPRVALERIDSEIPNHFLADFIKREESELNEAVEIKEEPVDQDFLMQNDSWSGENIFVADGFVPVEKIEPPESDSDSDYFPAKPIFKKRKKLTPPVPNLDAEVEQSSAAVKPKQTNVNRRSREIKSKKLKPQKFVQHLRARILKKPFTCPYCEEYVTEHFNAHVSYIRLHLLSWLRLIFHSRFLTTLETRRNDISNANFVVLKHWEKLDFEITSFGTWKPRMLLSEIKVSQNCKPGGETQTHQIGGYGSSFHHKIYKILKGRQKAKSQHRWVNYKNLICLDTKRSVDCVWPFEDRKLKKRSLKSSMAKRICDSKKIKVKLFIFCDQLWH